ncbi:hypothetical protein P4637_11785 [Halalkalibacterium halodurans]|uniref:BH0307 protein n=2 Tax=Halalkalibacterium halodurans TaxID=86665 RepID=Q9KG08_HALH5|nr:hypothetical protein [Halalkalibacterium halodurans]MDY7220815.1 hypothetical protein [Halalkalibacterium halodurans]MDY7240054.1 hypothetical protein [Halalkalibacterium halodurans]MED4081730.1 hypothetical protein [Halalkalibacterium halodurans]MED4085493.1 hypothetical protein [Halalkalibacterium halodurans]MED4106747.1 hypothetical protein [Halalkalibacterium halodurans]
MTAIKEFISSFLLVISWLFFAMSAYLFYWVIVFTLAAIIPFLAMLSVGLCCFYISKKLDSGRESKPANGT